MSLKLIFFPASLVFALIVGIFWVYPVYKGITEKGTGKIEILKQKEQELSKKEQMKANGIQLNAQLQSEKSSVDRVLEVIPRMSEEEKVVAMVSRSAQVSGVSLTDIGIETVALPKTAVSEVVPEEDDLMMVGEGEDGAVAPVSQKEMVMSMADVSFKFSGSYEGFKQFIAELEKASRKNKIMQTKISKSKDDTEKEVFSFEGKVSFAYAPIEKLAQGVISPAFSQDSFDFSPLNGIQEERNYLVPGDPIPAERANPFLP
jgi:Tfp pilus assembly protein PilO